MKMKHRADVIEGIGADYARFADYWQKTLVHMHNMIEHLHEIMNNSSLSSDEKLSAINDMVTEEYEPYVDNELRAILDSMKNTIQYYNMVQSDGWNSRERK